jgi:predicted HicB family RNase H-like nuclease
MMPSITRNAMCKEPWMRLKINNMNRKQLKTQAARYLKYIEWSDEDQCFIGRCPEIFDGAIHGTDEPKVYAELCQTVEEWLELLHKDGKDIPIPLSQHKKFSGNFVMRVTPALHRRLAAKALAQGESLNSYCVKALAKA